MAKTKRTSSADKKTAKIDARIAAELAALDADGLFARMQTLVDELPAMEDKGRRAQRAREAAKIDSLAGEQQAHAATLAHLDGLLDEHMAARNEALAAQDGQREESERMTILRLNEQRGYSQGAVENASGTLAHALENSSFQTVEEARGALMPKDELAALEEEVLFFGRDYSQTLAACQKALDEQEAAES